MTHWIFGPGAVGNFLAKRIRNNRLIGRSDPLPTTSGDPVLAIWIATPAWAVQSVLDRAGLPPGVPILITSNGLGLYDDALISKAAARGNPICRGALWLGVTWDPVSKVVTENGIGRVEIAPPNPTFRETLKEIGLACIEEADPGAVEWRKALTNLVINPICALAGRENGALLTEPDLLARAQRVLLECVAVARATGRILTPADQDLVWATARTTAANRNSMLRAKTA
ncbi:MAG: ketopantoate reductase C-terminal domain-containing protein [Bdellovibrionota bacterium]